MEAMLLQLHRDYQAQQETISGNPDPYLEEKLHSLYSQKEEGLQRNIEILSADADAGADFVRKLTGTHGPRAVVTKEKFIVGMEEYIRYIFTQNVLVL